MDCFVYWYLQTMASIWCENMPGYLSVDIICSEKRTVFRERSSEENCELRGTDIVQGKKASNTSKYECSKLRIPEVRREFELELRNRFSCLENNDHQTTDEGEELTQPDLEQKWGSFKSVFNESAK